MWNQVIALNFVFLEASLGCEHNIFQKPTLKKLKLALADTPNTAVSIKANTTAFPFRGNTDPYSTIAHPNVSMCAVVQNGFIPDGGGPPGPEDYSTACSCSDLIHSFASLVPDPYPDQYVSDTITSFETLFATLTTITVPHYLYVR